MLYGIQPRASGELGELDPPELRPDLVILMRSWHACLVPGHSRNPTRGLCAIAAGA